MQLLLLFFCSGFTSNITQELHKDPGAYTFKTLASSIIDKAKRKEPINSIYFSSYKNNNPNNNPNKGYKNKGYKGNKP